MATDNAKNGPAVTNKPASKTKKTDSPAAAKSAEEIAAEEQQAQISKEVEKKRGQQLADELQLSPYAGTLPTVGRIVQFFPSENDKQARDGDVEFVAAIVVKAVGTHRCDIRIFTATEESDRWTLRKDIPHKSKAHSLIVDGAYWDWPPRA